VAVALKAGDMELARQRLTRLMDIYPGRLYVELQPNDMPEQRLAQRRLVALAREFDLPLLATVDSHFPTADDAHAHDVWIACQTNKDVQDEGDLFAEDLNLYVMGEDRGPRRTRLPRRGRRRGGHRQHRGARRALQRPHRRRDRPAVLHRRPEGGLRRLHKLCGRNWEPPSH
jgi:hypothetical protein